MNNNKYLNQHTYRIYKGKDKFWYTYLLDEKGERIKKRRQSKKDLEELVIEYYKFKEDNPTIRTLFDEWNNGRLERAEIQPNSHTKYYNDFQRFFLPTDELCLIPMKNIDEEMLRNHIIDNINRYSLTHKSYEGMRTLINGVFKMAKRKKHTSINISSFFEEIDLPRKLFVKKQKSDSNEVFTDKEQIALCQYLRSHPSIHNYGLLLMFQTGLRIGELCVLQPKDITPKKISVNSTEIYYKENGKTVFDIKDSLKCGAETREVIITEKTLATLKRIELMNPNGEFLFEKNGKRINSTRFNYHLYKACDNLGIPHRSTHKIRKTYASMLIDSNVEESIIKSQLGHKDISTTRNYYYFNTHNEDYTAKQVASAINF